jgi:glycosyltransferase 2 family protein
MPRKLTISLIVGGAISALTLYLAFRNVPADQLLSYLGTINYWWIVPTFIIVVLTFILRALRWRVILKGVCEVSFWQSFHPTMIGFMMNCVLPGRVGELARPVLLKRDRGVAVTTGLSTIAAERIFDLISLIGMFILFFSTVSGNLGMEGTYFGVHLDGEILKSIVTGMIRLGIVLALFIALLTIDRSRNLIKQIIERIGQGLTRVMPGLERPIGRLFNLAQSIIDNIAIGLSLVRNPVQLAHCAGLTAAIWALTAVSYLVFAMGCPGINLSLPEFTTVMVIICFVIALPSVPGFWGLWEAGGVFALSIFGVAEKDALGFILVNHASQIFPVIGMGLISALITSVNILQLSHTGTAADGKPIAQPDAQPDAQHGLEGE